MKKLTAAALTAAALAAAPTVLLAQQHTAAAPARAHDESVSLGVELDYGNDSEFGIGGRLRHSLRGLFPNAPLSGIATVNLFFPGNGVTWVEGNYNVVYNFHIASSPKVVPYAGAGLNFVYVDVNNVGSDTQFGLNIVGGTEFRNSGRVTPFIEIRGVIDGGDQLVLTGGIRF